MFIRQIQLTWLDGDGTKINKGVENTEQLLSDGKRFTVTSTLKFQAKSEHHNKTYTCRAKSEADKKAKKAEIKIEVIGLKRVFFLFASLISRLVTRQFKWRAAFMRFMCVLTNQSIMI